MLAGCNCKQDPSMFIAHAYIKLAASNFPVVRNQTVVHILDWLKVAATKGFEPTTFILVKVY